MRIELRQPYKSISSLTTDDLPDFAVLIGRNGAGKSQLLEAIGEGRAAVSGIGREDIEKYDMSTFRPPDSSQANRNANQFARSTAEAFLPARSSDSPPIETAADIFCQSASDIERDSGVQARDEFERQLRDEIRHL